MPHHPLKILAVAACLSLAATAAQAATVYTATLLGANQNPAVNSPGTGFASLTINGDIMTVSATFQGLVGTTTASHVHCCAVAPNNVGVATQVPLFTGFPTGVTSGTYQHDFNLTDAATYNPAFVTAHGGTLLSARDAFLAGLAAGQAYFNIHTTFAPAGEIRGQLAAVPEPGTWALMIAGFGLVGAAVRRRRTAVAPTYAVTPSS